MQKFLVPRSVAKWKPNRKPFSDSRFETCTKLLLVRVASGFCILLKNTDIWAVSTLDVASRLSHPVREAGARHWAPTADDRPPVSLQEKVEAQRQRFRLEFEKSRGFLAWEEQLQLRRLEEEERATLHRLREGRAWLAQQGRALKELAQELEERCQRPAAALLEVRLAAWGE